MKATLSIEATTSADRWLHLWSTPDLATRTTIEWSPRLTRSLGRCYPERRLIRLAAFLEESENALLEEVLCHELAHLAARELHGRHIRPHGSEWKGCRSYIYNGVQQLTGKLSLVCNRLFLNEKKRGRARIPWRIT